LLFSFVSKLICFDDKLIIFKGIIPEVISIKKGLVIKYLNLKENLFIKKIQKEILIGTILGEASLERKIYP